MKQKKEITEQDLLDNLIGDWKIERPDLDASAMNIVGRILMLGKILEKRASKALSKNKIYYTDLDVLATLRRSGKPYQLSPTQLRKSVLITSGAMTALLDRLEKIKLLDRLPDPNDGRVTLARLTRKGKSIIDQAIEVRFEEATSAIKILTKREKATLAKLLKKVLGDLQEK